MVPYHTITYCTTVKHIFWYHSLPYRTVTYRTTVNHILQYHTTPHYSLPYYSIPYNLMSYQTISHALKFIFCTLVWLRDSVVILQLDQNCCVYTIKLIGQPNQGMPHIQTLYFKFQRYEMSPYFYFSFSTLFRCAREMVCGILSSQARYACCMLVSSLMPFI